MQRSTVPLDARFLTRLLMALTLYLLPDTASFGTDITFDVITVEPRSRIDALAWLGRGVIIAGTRGTHPGIILRSEDSGTTWHGVGNITGTEDITCLCRGRDGIGFLLTGGNVRVWSTDDDGLTWKDLGRISLAANPSYANAYGMLFTPDGSLLVADADSEGGHIHRSTDHGRSWADMGRISNRALYRLNLVDDGVIVNGWAGHVYKSRDDGITWQDMGQLADSDLYAIESLEDGLSLMGTKSGHVFLSRDSGETWADQGRVGSAADDFVWLGGRRVLYSTYTDDRELHLTEDAGATWRNIGGVNTGEPDDWLDHVIAIPASTAPDSAAQATTDRIIIGGTNKGFILRAYVSATD